MFGAFINVDAVVLAGNKTTSAAALIADANLVRFAIRISSASKLAYTFSADFSRQAVAIAVAHFDTDVIRASLPNSACVVVRAWQTALVSNTHMSRRTFFCSRAKRWNSNTALFRSGISLKSRWAFANSGMLYAGTERVRSTYAFLLARVLAFTIKASLIRSAISIAATSEQTRAINAGLVVPALVVADAGIHAHFLQAALARQAIFVVPTHSLALSVEASFVSTVDIRRAAAGDSDAAAFRPLRARQELSRASTNGRSVNDVAYGIRSARRLIAGVDASATLANRLRRTVRVSVRAVPFWPASRGKRIADGVGWASACVTGRRAFADG